jgi:ADP-heptose:LPS heptosyltransferase
MNKKPYVGVWLDHRRALLFWADEDAEMEIQEVESDYQEREEPTDSIEMASENGHAGGVPHASVEHRRREQLKHYYKKLDKLLKGASEIYLFGPGQAKKELFSLLEQDKGMRARIRDVDNADKKMTRRQMAARVREVFGLPRTSP